MLLALKPLIDSTLIRKNTVSPRVLIIVNKNQNQLRKCCIESFVLKTDNIAILVTSVNNHSSACYSLKSELAIRWLLCLIFIMLK